MSDTWYTPDNMNQACEHGHQRRKCPHCESIWQDERIAELEKANKRLRDALEAIAIINLVSADVMIAVAKKALENQLIGQG